MVQTFYEALKISVKMANKTNKNWLWFGGAVILWLGSYLVIRYCLDLENDDAGTFGDQFGAINALFTGLSFAGIIITLRQQQEELNAQRREFMTSRAMTIVYKQVELISIVISNSFYTIAPDESHPARFSFMSPEDYKKHEIHGIFAINKWKKIILSDKEKINSLKKLSVLIYHLLNSLSNSVSLLVKIRQNENMSDSDALLVFESFKYNIDHRVWLFIEVLREVDWCNVGLELEDIKEDVQIINSFLDEMEK
ncbi:MAG: hypothetical protein IPL20_00180 [Saprospiraceae bacterium]|nr:hypothetical protein [Saprospiraceae bacterium]